MIHFQIPEAAAPPTLQLFCVNLYKEEKSFVSDNKTQVATCLAHDAEEQQVVKSGINYQTQPIFIAFPQNYLENLTLFSF